MPRSTIMEMLEGFDLTGSSKDAGELAGSPTTPSPAMSPSVTPGEPPRQRWRCGQTHRAGEDRSLTQDTAGRPALGQHPHPPVTDIDAEEVA